ncbi:Xenobiotic-transporting ATPase [Bertholletia excelsa]
MVMEPKSLYAPLNREADGDGIEINMDDNITPFSKAGILSKFSFSWLNPLLEKGKEKILDEEDIPKLRHLDQAETCYFSFIELLSKQKEKGAADRSVLSTIFLWKWKAILVSGFFALIKVLALAAGPVLLRAFIRVAEGRQIFKNEAYALTLGIFLAKFLESVSERQWCFRTRLIGLQVRSMLSAAIYHKQLRLSNVAKATHPVGQIAGYVSVDAHKIGKFPYWLHQIWTTSLQICLASLIIYYNLGLATVAAVVVIMLSMLLNYPVAKLQHKDMTKLMVAQDRRLKAITEALTSMRVLKLYAWESHFQNVIKKLRREESGHLSAVQTRKGHHLVLFWISPVIASAATFWAAYFLGITLDASNVFTFLAALRILQEPMRLIPDVAAVFIEANVSVTRIMEFLEAPELENRHKQNHNLKEHMQSIYINSASFSGDESSSKPTLADINLVVRCGEKVAVCGEVGSGKSTLLAAILGEVPNVSGIVRVYGQIAHVSQTAWIQTGTIQDNILFGSNMDRHRYQEVLEKCSLIKDLEMLPFGDCTIMGERGVNLSGGQKQLIQLARALYQDADLYLLDDPFSAVDAHTATILFNEYVMEALSAKTVLLVTHQVDFLQPFDSILVISDGNIVEAASYNELLVSSGQFQNLVNAHRDTSVSDMDTEDDSQKPKTSEGEIQKINTREEMNAILVGQLIKKEERETGDSGFKPYIQYLNQSKGFLYLSLLNIFHLSYIIGQFIQSLLLAADLQGYSTSIFKLILFYSLIGCGMGMFLLFRSYYIVVLSLKASESIFSKLMTCLFRAPMSFFDSTPLGRILSRVSSDLSIVDLELAFKFAMCIGATMNTYFIFGILTVLTWPILFAIIPSVYITVLLQRFYITTAKEMMRIDGTTKSKVASHLAESVAGAVNIRAFGQEDRFFVENLHLIDANASSFFHNFSANEWLIQRLELLCAIVLSCSALALALLPHDASKSGYIGMALSYGLLLNVFLVVAVQSQCVLSNSVIAVERLEQYMHLPSEALEIIEGRRPVLNCRKSVGLRSMI